MELLKELRESIRNNFEGFELYYQLQVTSNGYRLKGAEALLRYHSKQRGFMSPVVFIPLLEQTELIIPVGKWVMRQAFAQCALWRKKYGDFNISKRQSFREMRLLWKLRRVCSCRTIIISTVCSTIGKKKECRFLLMTLEQDILR